MDRHVTQKTTTVMCEKRRRRKAVRKYLAHVQTVYFWKPPGYSHALRIVYRRGFFLSVASVSGRGGGAYMTSPKTHRRVCSVLIGGKYHFSCYSFSCKSVWGVISLISAVPPRPRAHLFPFPPLYGHPSPLASSPCVSSASRRHSLDYC